MRQAPESIVLRALCTALLCVSAAAPSLASDERWYKVELLVFTRDAVVTDEIFPPYPELAYPGAARYLHYPGLIAAAEADHPGRVAVDEFGRIIVTEPPPEGAIFPPPVEEETGAAVLDDTERPGPPPMFQVEEAAPLRPTPFVTLTADFRELGAAALRLSRSGGATVHFHETWLQPIPERAEALPLVLDESADRGDWPELQGSVLIYRSRFLHIETNLWRNTRGDGLPAAFRIAAPPLGPPRTVVEPYQPAPLAPIAVTATRYPVDFRGLPVIAPERPELAPVFPYRHAIRFTERRRMKRNELHYLDHPAMGVVIKITALDEDALESWAEAELMQADTWPASLTAPDGP